MYVRRKWKKVQDMYMSSSSENEVELFPESIVLDWTEEENLMIKRRDKK